MKTETYTCDIPGCKVVAIEPSPNGISDLYQFWVVTMYRSIREYHVKPLKSSGVLSKKDDLLVCAEHVDIACGWLRIGRDPREEIAAYRLPAPVADGQGPRLPHPYVNNSGICLTCGESYGEHHGMFKPVDPAPSFRGVKE